jgi:hypothetical protein
VPLYATVNFISSETLLHLLLLHVSDANPKVRAVVAKFVGDVVDKALNERVPGAPVSRLEKRFFFFSFDGVLMTAK